MSERTIIVTGGASGIGAACVHTLLSQGWYVWALDRQGEALQRLADETQSSRLITAEIDITQENEIDVAFEKFEGPVVAGLVNSAGIARDTPFMETTAEMFRSVFEVNVVGASMIAQRAVRAMEGRDGSIVHVGSVSGLAGNVGRSAYGASKAALINITRIMAVELAARGVRVNAVAPGPIETPLARDLHTESVRRRWKDRIPLQRYGTPVEIAEVCAFLLSEKSGYITGQIIAVDGGFCAAGLMPEPRTHAQDELGL
ncbi:SDR family oxidoreductase [Aminobacter sp. MSH1]|uniref:SDR family NAD(P)-dependent oxidoreductase n=1 Tax=Aminobacter sp. MSH1 TaxID=374606 RepID=UPI000D38D3C0|nr:SDR family oxidoreductase [Aminobacter sp. MSH1]